MLNKAFGGVQIYYGLINKLFSKGCKSTDIRYAKLIIRC